jgi:hypothetical protein
MRAVIEAAGFTGVRFSEQRWDFYSGASGDDGSAAKFGTQGVAIYAVKPDESDRLR